MDVLKNRILFTLILANFIYEGFGFGSNTRSVYECPRMNPQETLEARKAGMCHPGAGDSCCKIVDVKWRNIIPEWKSIIDPYFKKPFYSCKPLLLTLRLSHENQQAYKTVCKYLSKSRPLTMLELLKYLKAASYLNLTKSRHISIHLALSQKALSKIPEKADRILARAFKYPLIDYDRELEGYPGYSLDADEMKELSIITSNLSKELGRSVLADRALDELLVGFARANIAAASHYLSHINQALPGQQTPPGGNKIEFNCELFEPIYKNLNKFLTEVSSALARASVKGLSDKMKVEWSPMIMLLRSQQTYKELITAHCGREQKVGLVARPSANAV